MNGGQPMNLNPAELLDPVFNFLDALIPKLRRLPLPGVCLAGTAGDRLDIPAAACGGNGHRETPPHSSQASSLRCNRRANHHRQSSASKLTKCGTATTKNNGLSMTAFHHQQPDYARRAHKQANAGTLNFTSKIAQSICTVVLTKREKSDAIILKARCSRTAVSYRFYTRDALLLNCVRFFRLANSSPVIQRYPASRSRSVREPSGKTSGKVSCATSAQFPGNCRAVANTLPPNIRADDLQDDSQDGAQRSRECPRRSSHSSHATSRETSRLVEVLSSRSQP